MYEIDSHYWSRYCKLIAYAKSRPLPTETYTEKHHIWPKSLGGGNEQLNLISLTAREHILAHWILSKCFTSTFAKKKMQTAYHFIVFGDCNNSKKRPQSVRTKHLARAREAAGKLPPWNKGIPMTKEAKEKLSKAKLGSKGFWEGKKFSEEHKKKLSNTKAITRFKKYDTIETWVNQKTGTIINCSIAYLSTATGLRTSRLAKTKRTEDWVKL